MYGFEDFINIKTEKNESVGGLFNVITLYGLYLQWLGQQGKNLSEFQTDNKKQHLEATTVSELLFQLQIINAYDMECHKIMDMNNYDNKFQPMTEACKQFDNRQALDDSINKAKKYYFQEGTRNYKEADSRGTKVVCLLLMTAIAIVGVAIGFHNAYFAVLLFAPVVLSILSLQGARDMRRQAAYKVEETKTHIDNVASIQPRKDVNILENFGYPDCVNATKNCMVLTWNNHFTNGISVEQEVTFDAAGLAERVPDGLSRVFMGPTPK